MDTGILQLSNNHTFRWIKDASGEVYGWVDSPDDRIIEGTGGWYRTEDPEVAGAIAAGNLGLYVVKVQQDLNDYTKCQEV